MRGGSVLALDGAHIALPNASQYAGSGLLRAAGPGSLLEVSGLTNIGIPDPSPLSGLLSAVSREFSAYVGAESDPGDLSIGNAVTREFSVFVGAETDPGDLDIGNAVSREFSLFVGAETTRDLPNASAVSREVSLQNQAP